MGKKAKTSRYGEPTPAEEQPLIDEIIASPDDDAPRLILADWLEERGDPRAEFIRVQCRLAKMTGDEADYDALEDREAELLAAHGARWLKRQPALPGIAYGAVGYLRDFSLCEYDSTRAYFVRGMVELATPKTFLDFRNQAQALAERTVVRELRLSKLTFLQLSQVVRSAFTARCKGLLLTKSEVGAAGAAELAQSPLAANLETLTLSEFFMGDEGLAALLPKLKRVKRLGLSGDFLDGVEMVAKWKGLKNVRALCVDLNDDSFAESLAASPYLGGLRTLGTGSFLSDRAVKTLAGAKGLRQLRGLCLAHATINKRTAAQLAAFTHLRRLNLCRAPIDDTAARALGAIPTLRLLNLCGTGLKPSTIRSLKKSLPNCQILYEHYSS